MPKVSYTEPIAESREQPKGERQAGRLDRASPDLVLRSMKQVAESRAAEGWR